MWPSRCLNEEPALLTLHRALTPAYTGWQMRFSQITKKMYVGIKGLNPNSYQLIVIGQ